MDKELAVSMSVLSREVGSIQATLQANHDLHVENQKTIDKILVQTLKTNGRVNALEAWRMFMIGISILLPLLTSALLYSYFAQISELKLVSNNLAVEIAKNRAIIEQLLNNK